MKCMNCGSELGAGSTFCTYCGTRLDKGDPDFSLPPYAPPPGYGYGYGYYVQRKTSGMAIASMVLGIVSSVTLLPLIFGIGPLIGLLLGLQARKDIAADASHMEGEGFATAGVILGLSGLILALLFWIFVAVVSGIGG